MENNTVTLDTARKLKAAGFPQTTGMIWNRLDLPDYRVEQRGQRSLAGELDVAIAAPTAQEIADHIRTLAGGQRIEIESMFQGWSAKLAGDSAYLEGSTLAEALAALWLKLQEAK
jgi:hypothetical protein